MARRPPAPSGPRRNLRQARPVPPQRRVGRRAALGLALAVLGLLVLGGGLWYASGRQARLLARAEAASKAADWPSALRDWRAVNATKLARGKTFLAEARAALALGHAWRAEHALRRSTELDPSAPEPWRLWLELLRVEDRVTDAQRVGWLAYAAVSPEGRRGVLRDLTLALLADLPDDSARDTLARWSEADSADDAEPGFQPDARVALLQRFNTMPRPGDPPRPARVDELTAWLARRPDHPGTREALATALVDAGETAEARRVLDAWPTLARDARYQRLSGRWELDYGRDPAAASASFAGALAELPHDWKTRVRLARALRSLGREADARREAEQVNRLREVLDPLTLGPKLADDLVKAVRPSSDLAPFNNLSALCARVGLARLAEAWRIEALSANAIRPTGG